MLKKFFQRLKWRALASQLRKPGGMTGKKVGIMMNKANAFLYETAFKQMNLKTGEHVLEIGFGNGHFFKSIFSQAPSLSLYGIDYSPLMVRTATELNSQHIADGSLKLVSGSSHEMPWPDNSFDKIFCINVIYFWSEPLKHLLEVKRVLKPGGQFYAIFRTQESMRQMPFTAFGFVHYTSDEWKKQLLNAGLAVSRTPTFDEPEAEFKGKTFQIQSICAVAIKTS